MEEGLSPGDGSASGASSSPKVFVGYSANLMTISEENPTRNDKSQRLAGKPVSEELLSGMCVA
jgi:hypothetical protein